MSILVFPGQGFFDKEEAFKIYNKYPEANEIWQIVNEIIDIKRLFNENINNSHDMQLAVSAYCLSIFNIIKDKIQYSSACGLSLGEHICLPACKVLDYSMLFKILSYKGKVMDLCSGKMISVIYGENINMLSIKDLYIANDLFENNIILSGTDKAIEEAKKQIKARKIIDINVSGPFHSPLMQKAKEKFEIFMQDINLSDAIYPLYSGISFQLEHKGNIIKQHMIDEMTSRISFHKIINNQKDSHFIVIGGGKAMQSIMRGYNYTHIDNIEDIEQYML